VVLSDKRKIHSIHSSSTVNEEGGEERGKSFPYFFKGRGGD